MQILTISSLITFLWLVYGYSLAFSPTQTNGTKYYIYGNSERLWLRGMMLKSAHFLAPSIPEALFCTYQLGFAILTAGLICGTLADRIKYHSMIVFVTFWHIMVYCPIAHCNWHPQGLLYNLGVLDYAGGNVVHICAGMSGFAATLVIGNRKGFSKERYKPHNMLMTLVGMCMLWVGSYGFNAGSGYKANQNACYALLATQIATSVSGLMWMFLEWAIWREPSIYGLISGAIAGLVCITPAVGYVDMTGAFFVGFVGGPLCYAFVFLRHLFGFNDVFDGFGVHAIGGVIGGLATGILATDQVALPFAYGDKKGISIDSVIFSSPGVGALQLKVQAIGIAFTIAWSFIGSLILLLIMKYTIGLNVSDEEDEEEEEEVEEDEMHSKIDRDVNNASANEMFSITIPNPIGTGMLASSPTGTV